MSVLTVGPAVKIDTFSYSAEPGAEYRYPVSQRFSVDLNNDGLNEVVFAAFETQPNTSKTFTNSKISIFGWKDNNFVNLSSSLLPSGADLAHGVADIAFGDFNGDGLTDMYLAATADMDYMLNAFTLINQGSYFTKIDMGPTQWEHGVSVYDINKDGYDDVVVAGYLTPTPYFLGSSQGLVKGQGFSNHWTHGSWSFGSGVAVADWLGNGTVSKIVVDSMTMDKADTLLLSIEQGIDGSLHALPISSLPTPRIDLFDSHSNPNFKSSHDIRVVAFDFSRDGLPDAIVFSRAQSFDGVSWPERSEIQFYENKGQGHFVDVTSTRLFGYRTDTSATYTPVFTDLNSDGLIDIFLSESSFDAVQHRSTSMLLQQPDGTFVDTGRVELSAPINSMGGSATVVTGPGGQLYMVATESQFYDYGNTTVSLIPFAFKDPANNINGNNKFYTVGLSDKALDGGAGIDTAVFSGRFSDYAITVNGSKDITTTDSIAGRDGVDRLVNIERFKFDDGVIAIDFDGTAGQAYRLYTAALDREPDLEGLGYWISALDRGASLQSVARGFVDITEFRTKFYGDGSNATFVTALYNNVLDRAPEPEGYNFWLGALNRGADRADVLVGFSESPENYANAVELTGGAVVYQEWML